MGDGERPFAAPRLKREECKRTKHDSDFSKWQVLIGATDWQDHAVGKEGAARYRVHNLPSNSGPGLYELGIARSTFGRDYAKIDPDDIVVVYLGQADNVRTRLQRYGRSGAHLGDSYSSGHWNNSQTDSVHQALSLFEEIFSRGFSIVFRWSPMKDKREAEKTEAQLLATFDYAWNKGGNGERRPSDVLQKIQKMASSTGRLPKITKKLLLFNQGEVGIKIKASKPIKPENVDEDSKNFLSGIFKFSRSRPTIVSDTHGTKEGVPICGFILNDGIPCNKPPASGRKRCEEHKGKRIYGATPKSNRGGSSKDADDDYVDKNHNTACGVNLEDGNFCTRQPAAGRKRCEAHKGLRISGCVSKPNADDKCHLSVLGLSFGTSDDCMNENAESSSRHRDEHSHVSCGATLGNGSFCRRQPTKGNKRCWQHIGQSVDSSLSGSNASYMRTGILTCGVGLLDGSLCMKTPVSGRKRCEQHKGLRTTRPHSTKTLNCQRREPEGLSSY